KALGGEALQPLAVGAPGTERADIEAVGTQRRDQCRVVDLGVVSQRYERRCAVGLQAVQRLVGPLGAELDPGKTRLGRPSATRIDDDRLVVGRHQHRHQRLGDVHRADDKATAGRAEDLDQDLTRRRVERRGASAADRVPHGLATGIVEFELALESVIVEEELGAAGDIGREHGRAGFACGGEHRVEIFALHSTRSTKIATLPPQARPTSQAWSSLMPKSRRRGFPSLMTSCASPITAPSTQPPETEPTNSPLSLTTSLAPGWRGEEPQVLTTVASATPLPSTRQRDA